MEIVKICTALGFYKKLYDSSYDEHSSLINSVKSDILPDSVINSILEGITLRLSKSNYNQLINFIKNNADQQIEIYVDEFGAFRRIIVRIDYKVKLITNSYF